MFVYKQFSILIHLCMLACHKLRSHAGKDHSFLHKSYHKSLKSIMLYLFYLHQEVKIKTYISFHTQWALNSVLYKVLSQSTYLWTERRRKGKQFVFLKLRN